MTSCVDFCKALSDETRQRILQVLQEKGEVCVSDLVGMVNVSQPTISHHLMLLKNARLVNSRREGKQIFYSIDRANVLTCCGMLFAKFAPGDAHLSGVMIPFSKVAE